MKTTTKKPSTKKSFNEPREDRFIKKILEFNINLEYSIVCSRKKCPISSVGRAHGC